MKRLQFSGYDQVFRHDVMKTALKRYDDSKQATARGEKPKHRNTKKQKVGREAVMFVQATKNEELKKEVQRCEDKHKVNIRIQEKVDNSIRRELQRSNLFKDKDYIRESCLVCEQGSGIDCRARGCVYEMQCENCRRKYHGQIRNSIEERTEVHYSKRQDTSSPLYRHSQLFHNGEQFPVSIKILKKCFGDATERKITEAVLIDKLSATETMNGKNEWTYVKLNKLSTI